MEDETIGCIVNLRGFTDDKGNEEETMTWKERISVDPNICHGKPCIKGTRVMVSVIVDNVAAGETYQEIMRGYHIDEEDIQAALHYAAELARDRVLLLPTG